MSTISIAKKIEDIKTQLNDLSSEIEKEKDSFDVGLSWDFVYSKAIQLNETANRVKVQVKLKTR